MDVRFWCDRGFAPQARSIIANFDKTISVETIMSGKFRRYNHLSMVRQLCSPFSIVLPNIRDALFVFIGFLQSIFKLLKWRPDVIFIKGGFVCLPVGFAAKLLKIPLVIHDSDVHPGLTNRILAKWADKIATGAPLDHYPYPKEISKYVGIPISREFCHLSDAERQNIKKEYGFDQDKPLVVITGGGLGAKRINDATAECLDELLKITSIMLISGSRQYDELRALVPEDNDIFQLHAFIGKNMASLLGSADVVVSRAGATTLLELAILARPTVLIPNGQLTGGHQLKNAKMYGDAVEIIDETELEKDPFILKNTLKGILRNKDKMRDMSNKINLHAKPNAARDVVDMIIDASKHV